MDHTIERDQTAAVLHRARSEFLDAFGDLEAQLLKLIRSSKKPVNAPQTTALVGIFRKLEQTPLIANANLAKRDGIADRIVDLLEIRADVVHSRMIVHNIEGEGEARFINARYTHEKYPRSRNLTAANLAALTHELADLTTELGRLNRPANPAS